MGRLHGLEPVGVEVALLHQEIDIPVDRVVLLPRLDQAFGVILGSTGLFMTPSTERLEFQQDGPRAFPHGRGRLGDGLVDREDVVAVDADRVFLRDAIAGRLVGEMGTAELLAARGGQPPVVALDAEQHGQLPHGRNIEGFVEVAFTCGAVAGEDQRGLSGVAEFGREGDAVGDAELRPEVADHPHDVMGHAPEMEAPVVSLGEAGGLALELGEQLGEFDAPGGEHAEVAVHREDELVRLEGGRAPDGDGLLAHAAEPFADAPLPQQAEHFLLDEPGEQQVVEQPDHAVGIEATVLDLQRGNVGGRHVPNLPPHQGAPAGAEM